jgi:hypothetical protein
VNNANWQGKYKGEEKKMENMEDKGTNKKQRRLDEKEI